MWRDMHSICLAVTSVTVTWLKYCFPHGKWPKWCSSHWSLNYNQIYCLICTLTLFFPPCMANWCVEISAIRCNWWVCTKSDHSNPRVPVWSMSGWRGEGLWLPAVAGSGMLSPGLRLVRAPLEDVRCCGGGNRAKRVLHITENNL